MSGFSLKRKCAWCLQHEAAQRGEVSEYQPVVATPWRRSETEETPVTFAILAINLLVFIMMVATGVNPMEPSGEALVKWGANVGVYTLGGEWWRLIAHMFLHIGVIHLAFNMWFLYSLGPECERLLGSVTFTLMYLISGVAGGLASLFVHPYSISAGASGALFGILGTMIGAYKFGEFSMPRAMVEVYLRSMLYCAGINLALGVFGNSDNAAHVGGLLAGFFIGVFIAKAAPEHNAYGRRAFILLVMASVVTGGLLLVRNRSFGPSGVSRSGPAYIRYLQQGKTDQAIAELQKLIAKNPDDYSARAILASVYRQKGSGDLAIKQYEWLINNRPVGDSLRFGAAFGIESIFSEEKRYADGEKYFTDLAQRAPSDPAPHYSLALLAATQDKNDVAIAEYRKVLELDPNQYSAYTGLGQIYAKLKKYDDAIAVYKKALASSEDGAEQSDIQAAISDVEKARAEDSKSK